MMVPSSLLAAWYLFLTKPPLVEALGQDMYGPFKVNTAHKCVNVKQDPEEPAQTSDCFELCNTDTQVWKSSCQVNISPTVTPLCSYAYTNTVRYQNPYSFTPPESE